jgi:leucyl-tRNA synthetase
MEWKQMFATILSPFAPHLTEELWHTVCEKSENEKSIYFTQWPKYDETLIIDETIKIAVQVM